MGGGRTVIGSGAENRTPVGGLRIHGTTTVLRRNNFLQERLPDGGAEIVGRRFVRMIAATREAVPELTRGRIVTVAPALI